MKEKKKFLYGVTTIPSHVNVKVTILIPVINLERERNEQALEDVKSIVENLQEKHQNQFTPEQYNAWAQCWEASLT